MLMADRFIHEKDLPAPNETSLEDIFLPLDYKPSREDVICSRGSISYHHAANIRLRELIDESLEEYQRSKSKVERSALVSRIIETVQGEKGRFIRQDPKTKRWFQVRSRTTREKVGQAIRAALKKREQHDSQFAQAKKHAGSNSSLFGAEEPTVIGRSAPMSLSPSYKLRETSRQASSFSTSLSHTRMTQLRHDRGSQNLQHYFDTIPLPGTADAQPPSAFSPVGQPLYTRMISLHEFKHGNTEPNRYPNQQEIRNPSNSPFSPAHGIHEMFSSRHKGNNYLQRDAAGVLPHINQERQANANSLLELQQESRGFPKPHRRQPLHEAVAAPAAAPAAREGGSSWYPSPHTFPPETAAMLSGNCSPGLDNGHFHSIAHAHQTASETMMSVVPPGSLRATIPNATASSLSLSITEEEEEGNDGSPTIREGIHEN